MYLQLSIPDLYTFKLKYIVPLQLYTFKFIYYVKLQRGLDKLVVMFSFSMYVIYLVGIAVTGLTQPHVYACLKTGPDFQRSYILVCLC